MNCPLCGKDLIESIAIDPATGRTIFWKKCPVILNLIRIYNPIKFGKSSTRQYDTSHYWFEEHNEIAYTPPYRIHNVFKDGHCEVSFCPIEQTHPPYRETYIIFKSPLIEITEENKLRQRIKTLIAFS